MFYLADRSTGMGRFYVFGGGRREGGRGVWVVGGDLFLFPYIFLVRRVILLHWEFHSRTAVLSTVPAFSSPP